MSHEEIREELILLQSSLVDDELRWIDEEVEAEWEVSLLALWSSCEPQLTRHGVRS